MKFFITKLFLEYVLSPLVLEGKEFILQFCVERIQWTVYNILKCNGTIQYEKNMLEYQKFFLSSRFCCIFCTKWKRNAESSDIFNAIHSVICQFRTMCIKIRNNFYFIIYPVNVQPLLCDYLRKDLYKFKLVQMYRALFLDRIV